MPSTYYIILLLLVLIAAPHVFAHGYSYEGSLSEKKRLLGMIYAENYNHIDPLRFILNEYVAMCESGFQVTLALISTMQWSKAMKQLIYADTYCYETNTTIPIQYVSLEESGRDNPAYRHSIHRKVAKQYLHLFDVFIYHEDDTIVKFANVVAYLKESETLNTLLAGATKDASQFSENYAIGFIRMRRRRREGEIHGETFGPEQILEQDLFEEQPETIPTCVRDKPYIALGGDTGQGSAWVFTHDQLVHLQSKCGFLDHEGDDIAQCLWARQKSEDLHEAIESQKSSSSNSCGLIKLIPVNGLASLALYHYYEGMHGAELTQKSRLSLFHRDQELREGAGCDPAGASRESTTSSAFPSCWKDVHAEYSKESFEAPPTPAPMAQLAYKDKSLIQFLGGKEVFVAKGNVLHPIPDIHTFYIMGFELGDVQVKNHEDREKSAFGDPINSWQPGYSDDAFEDFKRMALLSSADALLSNYWQI